MLEELRQCEVCPFRCKVNRLEGKIGRCGCNDKIKIALASLHYYEEPCISGNNGSGTVFFSNCNLNCLFCQNYKISQEGKGRVGAALEFDDQGPGGHHIARVDGAALEQGLRILLGLLVGNLLDRKSVV